MRAALALLFLLGSTVVADDAVDGLVRALWDHDRGVRYAAVQALGKARVRLPAIVTMLDDPEWCVRQAAGEALQQFGRDALPTLETIMRVGSPHARVEAVDALSRVGAPGLAGVRNALDDSEHRVVLEALDGLVRLRPTAKELPRERLRKLAGSDNERVRIAAGWLLSEPVAAEPERDSPPAVRVPPAAPLAALRGKPLDAETIVAIGRHGAAARSFADALRALLASDDARLRGAATWALGRLGFEMPAMLRDDDPVVRELAVATLRAPTALRLLATGSVRERRLAARVAVTATALRDPDVVVRIEAARKLGKGLDDPARDVRTAAALASGDPRALRDPCMQVRAAALRSIKTDAAAVGPFLEHGDPSISRAAADALIRMKDAGPVATRLGRAHLGVLHYAPEIYEALGAAATPTVATLIPLLKHKDVNVREVAARCLGATRDRVAAPPLVAALADRRLPVVGHAAFALGRIGITPSLLNALTNERPRVRAYAAFAIGQAKTKTPIPYAPRLPVLDCGERSRVKAPPKADLSRAARIRHCREGIKSADPRVAIPCAAGLDFEEIGPWETERCIELLAPEGFRPGSPIDFDRYRSYLGPTEFGATLEYLFYPPTTIPARGYLYGHLHRCPHSSNIPALLWFEARGDHLRLEEFGSLGQPYLHTQKFGELLGFEKFWESIAQQRAFWIPDRFWLDEVELTNERAALLVELAVRHEDKDHAWVAIRALARVDDAYSERFLEAEARDSPTHFARAALAKRGHPLAMADLVGLAEKDEVALGLLIEFRPRLAAAILRERLPDARWAQRIHDAIYHSYHSGIRWTRADFLGVEPLLNLEKASAEAIVATAVHVPGCRTKRFATTALAKLRGVPSVWSEYDGGDADMEFLWSASPARTLELLRTWSKHDDDATRAFACRRLLRAGDVASAAAIVRWLKTERDWVGQRDVPLRLRTPAILRALDQERWYALSLEQEGPDERTILDRHPEAIWDNYNFEKTPWLRAALDRRWTDRGIASSDSVLMQLALWPDAAARRELWSIYRAGRYRWVVWSGDTFDLTLGNDLSTLPHWIDALESNCCVISGRLEGAFEDLFGIGVLYSCATSGVGQPPSERVHDWFRLYGGDLVFCPLTGRFVARPEP